MPVWELTCHSVSETLVLGKGKYYDKEKKIEPNYSDPLPRLGLVSSTTSVLSIP